MIRESVLAKAMTPTTIRQQVRLAKLAIIDQMRAGLERRAESQANATPISVWAGIRIAVMVMVRGTPASPRSLTLPLDQAG
ncbi:hypothetical protein QLQ12_41245 [Actinoplanes sp. NEAU-A12]|uniref:Uncharacterized protein n=1 Tax=Actinoplanes sandaracinus TaxID=3045177 RepID=A0ABT6WZ57_9ACTN|nr:hypothetical protein [Actinoplanes sandaracinus]MDI6105031.1 hypothetical protein [Actinoplanes sandaracinus]